MSNVVTRLVFQLSSLAGGTIPQVEGVAPEFLDQLFEAGNKLIATLNSLTKRVYGASRAVVLQREIEYRTVGITSEYFGERNPGASKDFKPVTDRYKSVDKSTLSKMLKVMRGEYQACQRVFALIAGDIRLVTPEPVEVPPEAAAVVDHDAIAIQQARNLAASLERVESAKTFTEVFGIIEAQLQRGFAIVKADTADETDETVPAEPVAVAA